MFVSQCVSNKVDQSLNSRLPPCFPPIFLCNSAGNKPLSFHHTLLFHLNLSCPQTSGFCHSLSRSSVKIKVHQTPLMLSQRFMHPSRTPHGTVQSCATEKSHFLIFPPRQTWKQHFWGPALPLTFDLAGIESSNPLRMSRMIFCICLTVNKSQIKTQTNNGWIH